MANGKIDHRRAARGIIMGEPASQALEAAGYNHDVARQGLKSLLFESTPLREAFQSEMAKWQQFEAALPSPERRSKLARLRLVMNVLAGKDQAVQSVKLLGQDREVNMFEPEVAVGIQVAVNPPSSIKTEFLEAEDPVKPDK